MATLAEDALTQGTRDVFLGHSIDDQYLIHGTYFGPGVVNVPNEWADELERAVVRVSLERDPKQRVDPKKIDTPRKVGLDEATDLELQRTLDERKRQREANATIGAIRPEEMVGMTAEQITEHNTKVAQSSADAQAQAAKDHVQAQEEARKALEKLNPPPVVAKTTPPLTQSPPPPPPPPPPANK